MATRTNFSALSTTTQDARVRKALEAGAIVTLKSGDSEEAAAMTIALELPESELPAVAEALERISASRREYEAACAVPLSERTAKHNARIRQLGNRWENTAAGNGRAPGEPEPETTEDTIVQIRGKDGEWTDYARTTRREALATLEAGKLPGHSKPEPLRAVDWITKEEIEPAPAGLPVDLETGAKLAEAVKKPRARRGVTVQHVRPVEPDYSKMPARSQAKAKREYTAALAAFEAATQPAEEKPASPKAPKPKAGSAGRATSKPTDDGFDWKAADLPAKVLELKQTGLTIKQVAEKLGFPADAGERIWHRISLIYRAEADRQGVARQARSAAKETATN
jgi:hypothetical protein